MRILLSAFACEPGVGSEPGIGWRWATELARTGHDVVVVTPSSKRAAIEAELQALKETENLSLEFVFYEPAGVLAWHSWYKVWPHKTGHRLYWSLWEHIYHTAWQYGAFRLVQGIHRQKPFDVVHHITYGVARRSSFMGNLRGARFVFGPLGGGERSPWRLLRYLSFGAKVSETTRYLSIALAKFNPLLWRSFQQADVIFLKTRESAVLVPKRYRSKVRVRLEIGRSDAATPGRPEGGATDQIRPFTALFVGRFLHWKGMDYGIRAFARLAQQDDNVKLVLIGAGPEENRWRALVASHSIEHKVDWVPWVNQDALAAYYRTSDVFLFPSLHDSSGNVVLESISNGLPVVCFDLGGPAVIIDRDCAKVCKATRVSAEDAVDNLFAAMKSLSADRHALDMLRYGCLRRSEAYVWERVVQDLYQEAGKPL